MYTGGRYILIEGHNKLENSTGGRVYAYGKEYRKVHANWRMHADLRLYPSGRTCIIGEHMHVGEYIQAEYIYGEEHLQKG